MKTSAERAQAFVAGVQADIGDAVISSQKQLLGVVDPQPCHELVRSLLKSLGEQAVEIERR